MSIEINKRLSYIDFLKVASAFMIVMLHVSATYVDLTGPALHSLDYFLNYFSRVALPIFVMISGALLLRDQYHFKFKKKFFFIARVYIIWSAFYVLVHQIAYFISGNPLLTLPEMIVQWIRGPYHFWYLAMLMGFYLLMPILERIKDFRTLSCFLALGFFITYIFEPLTPFLPDCISFFIQTMIVLNPGTTFLYFLLGAWLNKLPLEKHFFQLACLSFGTGLALCIYRFLTVTQFDETINGSAMNLYSQLLMAIGFFYGARYFFRAKESRPLLVKLSRYTLYIYVISAFIIFSFEQVIKDVWNTLVPAAGFSVLLWTILCFIGSAVAASLMLWVDQWLKTRRQH